MPSASQLDADLEEFIGQFYDDPLGFVECCFDWPVNGHAGPDVWQREILTEIGNQVKARAFDGVHPVMPIRIAVSSGRGSGKGALAAWLTLWIMSTRRHAIGTVTANTNDQLEEKTWATLRTWHGHVLTASWFEVNSAVMFRKGQRAQWKVTPASCAPENAVAFQGQHAPTSTSFMIFDEASGIHDEIFSAAEGGMTDGEPMMFLFFNPTKNSGYAYRAVFGNASSRWITRVVDARDCMMPNKDFIAEWLEDCGGNEDDDFFKVHVRGLPPSADEAQYIDSTRITAAKRRVPQLIGDEPLVAGVDVSGGGGAWTVCRFRKGDDARYPPIRITGEKSQDRNHIVSVLAERLSQGDIDAMFIDMAFGAAVVERLRALGYRQVFEVNFGGESADPACANKRAEMAKRCKDWLGRSGAIDAKDERLAMDLAKPGYHLNQKNKLVIESKASMQKRGEKSPDDGDSLWLTWAQPVKLVKPPSFTSPGGPAFVGGGLSWAS